MSHRPLSQELSDLLASHEGPRGLTINQLIEKTAGRGVYLVLIVLNIPFILPVPLLGLSTIFGLAIALMACRLLSEDSPRLPRWFGDREIPEKVRKLITHGGIRALQWVEKVIRPRRSQWMRWRGTRVFHVALMVAMALMLALPLPILLTNSFPAATIILIATSMMEEDGVSIFFGYGMVVATLAYFGLWAGAISAALLRIVDAVRHFFA